MHSSQLYWDPTVLNPTYIHTSYLSRADGPGPWRKNLSCGEISKYSKNSKIVPVEKKWQIWGMHIPVYSIKESSHERKRHSNQRVLTPNCMESNQHVSVFQLRFPHMNVEGTRTLFQSVLGPKCICLCLCVFACLTPQNIGIGFPVPRAFQKHHMYGLWRLLNFLQKHCQRHNGPRVLPL